MQSKSMQAIILAGGKGTRLRPYTTVLPKPLMPIGDMPILEIVLRQLKSAGFTSVILAVGYMEHLFRAFFQDGERYGLKIEYSFEKEPLGTAGPIALMLEKLEDNFLLMNGDLLTNIDYQKLFNSHRESRAAATIALHKRTVNIAFGVVDHDENGRLVKYREKPSFTFDVSMGINVINRASIEKFVSPSQFLNIPDLMMKLSENGEIVNCYREECEWLDIGRVDDYKRAIELFESDPEKFLPNMLCKR